MKLGLDGKTVLVVGASQGLGKAIALAFIEEGCQVIAAARSVDKIEAWKSKLTSQEQAKVSIHKLDLAERSSVDALADQVLAAGGVDILINNCGGPAPSRVLDTNADQWEKAFASMASSIFHLTARLIPPMIERSFGRIITIGSSGIEQPIPNLAISNGIRSAVSGWSKTLSAEVAANGITVNMVLPGRIDTERVQSLDEAQAKQENKSLDAVRKLSTESIPAKRYGTPEEFAAVTVFLASEPAGYVTGSMIRIDGGLTRSV